MNRRKLVLCHIIFSTFLSCAQDKNPVNNAHHYEVIVDDLDNPWSFTFLPDKSILINEKDGRMIHYKNGRNSAISNVPEIYLRGQGGLLDVQLHPDFAQNSWIYFTMASSIGSERGGHTAMYRAKLKGDALENIELLYKASPNTTKGQHFGSRIVFDDNGYLYFTIGDRGARDINPQDITRDGGKVYRLHDDGRIPEDNPFVNVANAKTAIYSYGHRNPQGMTIHPETRSIWIHEHGPRGGDEINIIGSGKNYGWPVISYGINYSGTKFTDLTEKEGMEQPLHYWVPSIAPSGMAFISSDQYGNWKGNLLVGSLKFQYLDLIHLENGQVVKEERLLDGLGRVRSIEEGPDGSIYVGIENLGIVKLIRN
ncbi:MAG: PQQ-dependent sugar dehydrogenase [Psychroserpens sp.]|nr:PQQ-dependent sugar dehydrogenase [Psychroserpens sp.]